MLRSKCSITLDEPAQLFCYLRAEGHDAEYEGVVFLDNDDDDNDDDDSMLDQAVIS